MNLFDGWAGGLSAALMARLNAAAEREAAALLAPGPRARVLVIGFGPGLGIAALAARAKEGLIVGVDPSAAMVKAASRRNRTAIEQGRVRLLCASAEAVESDSVFFDAAMAVNALQLCEPLEPIAQELHRVLKPNGRLVTLTHAWRRRSTRALRRPGLHAYKRSWPAPALRRWKAAWAPPSGARSWR